MSPDADATDTPEPEEPRDTAREALRDAFAAELGDAVVDSHITVGHTLWVRVTAEAWRTAGQVARDHLGMRWFDFLSVIDWLPSPYGRYEDDGMVLPEPVDPTSFETGVTGGDTRFQVFARVVNVVEKTDVIFKADVPESLTVPSWVPTYDGADWHEREAWEMFGVTFEGHPGLRHMYLPGDFEGYPLRKDFPLIARIVKPWPGIVDVEPMPEEPAADAPAEDAESTENAESPEAADA